MTLHCPECGAAIRAEDINEQAQTATCRACAVDFSVATNSKRRKFKKPEILTLTTLPDCIKIRYRQVIDDDMQSPAYILGAGVWVAFMVSLQIASMPILALLVGLVLVLLGAGGYWVFMFWLNETVIVLDNQKLRITRRGMSGELDSLVLKLNLNRDDLVEITCEEARASLKQLGLGPQYCYLRARLCNGDVITLLKPLTQNYVHYIAQELNEELNASNDIDWLIPTPITTSRKQHKRKKPPLLTQIETTNKLTLHYRLIFEETEREALSYIGLSLAGLAFGVALFTDGIRSAPEPVPNHLHAWIAIVALLVMGVYMVAALWFNDTTITLDDKKLTAGQGPTRWITGAAKVTLNRDDVIEIICRETTESAKKIGLKRRYFEVQALRQIGDTTTLLTSLPQDYAFYIKQELNDFLDSTNDELVTLPEEFSDQKAKRAL